MMLARSHCAPTTFVGRLRNRCPAGGPPSLQQRTSRGPYSSSRDGKRLTGSGKRQHSGRRPCGNTTGALLRKDGVQRTWLFGAHKNIRELIAVQERLKTTGLKRTAKKRIKVVHAHIAAWERIIGTGAVQSVRKHWSGTGGLEEVSRRIAGWHLAYTTVYRDTSQYAHGADATSHVRISDKATSLGTFKILPGDDECVRVMTTANVSCWSPRDARINERFGLNVEALARKQ